MTFPEGLPGLRGEEKDYIEAVTDRINYGIIVVLRKCGLTLLKEAERDYGPGEDSIRKVLVWRIRRLVPVVEE